MSVWKILRKPKSDQRIGLTISLMMREHSNRKVEGKEEWADTGRREEGIYFREGRVGEKNEAEIK